MRRGPTARRSALRRAGLLLAVATPPLGWLLAAAPAHAARPAEGGGSTTATVTIGDSVEAWYSSSPIDLCTSPLGCPPSQAPTSPYPADTLHIGVAGGRETSRTYVQPDLMALPFGATAQSGTMTLPVAMGTTDGTSSPASAKILVCLATKPAVDGTQGSTATPPPIDCDTASAHASYDAKRGAFTVNLTPFLTAWSGGAPSAGLALLPDTKSAQPSEAWHVTFNGRKRAASHHISSVVTVQVTPAAGNSVVSVPAAQPPAAAAPPAATANLPLPAAASAAGPVAAPPVVAAAPQQPARLRARPVALSRGFQYPMAFLAPLALLAAAVFFARLFTRDATPIRVSS